MKTKTPNMDHSAPTSAWTEDDIRARIVHEIEHGGTLAALPCPYCSLPRCQRSDYIRCQRCGLNWLPGDDPAGHPRLRRTTPPPAAQPAPDPESA